MAVSQIISIYINKDKLENYAKVHENGLGEEYYALILFVHDEMKTKFSHDVQVIDSQSEDLRELKAEQNHVGIGRVVWKKGQKKKAA